MKKQIISLVVLVSLSCQLTYPMIEGVRKRAASISEYLKGKGAQIRELYTLYGKTKVDDAIATIKKYTPKGFIARIKEAGQEEKMADKALEVCIQKNCAQERRDWEVWLPSWSSIPMGSAEYKKGLSAANRDSSCRKNHCLLEQKRVAAAYRRGENLALVQAIGISLGISALAISLSAGAIAAAEYDAEHKIRYPVERTVAPVDIKQAREYFVDSPQDADAN